MGNLIPFNLELLKEGRPVVTLEGKPVRVLCTDYDLEDFPIIAAITTTDGYRHVYMYTELGRLNRNCIGKYDLYHPVPELYTNIYPGTRTGKIYTDLNDATEDLHKHGKTYKLLLVE